MQLVDSINLTYGRFSAALIDAITKGVQTQLSFLNAIEIVA